MENYIKFCPTAPRLDLRFYEIERLRSMQKGYVECSELSGKTIQAVRIFKDTGDGTDVQIDLTDGTSFTRSLCISRP